MATLVSELITRIRQRSDNEHTGGNFVTDTEIIGLINVAYKELWGCLVRYSMHQTESVQTILANGAMDYDLDDDHLACLAVFRLLDETRRISLKRHSAKVRPDVTTPAPAYTYRLMNNAIQFFPCPDDGTYEIVYIPKPEELTASTDEIDGVNGWEEFIVVSVAGNIAVKEQMDDLVRIFAANKAELKARIIDEANMRDLSESHRITVEPRSEHAAALDELECDVIGAGASRYWNW